jgi:hypothetical protein
MASKKLQCKKKPVCKAGMKTYLKFSLKRKRKGTVMTEQEEYGGRIWQGHTTENMP